MTPMLELQPWTFAVGKLPTGITQLFTFVFKKLNHSIL